ncbi:acyltransferase [Novosphingobium sp. SG751A]|uniref:acyltransferase family protein n=1 Tax=Novosphingobium sp. SG751A TaxID=2587000 RepID=UPI0015554740|nr:acyltransferase [Novosphingobium sp. SG751A]
MQRFKVQSPSLRSNLPALTGIRFFAAFAVLLFHYGSSFVQSHGAPVAIANILHNGSLGVPLFFILSGFILSYAHEDERIDRAFIVRFYVARLARIYPVYLFALLMALPVLPNPLPGAVVVKSLLLVQSWQLPGDTHDHDWIFQAWSLSVEWFFYALFPVILPISRCFNLAATMAAMLVACALIYGLGTPLGAAAPLPISLGGFSVAPWIPVLRLPEFIYGMGLCRLFLVLRNPLSAVQSTVVEGLLALATLGLLTRDLDPQASGLFAILVGLLLLVLAYGRGLLSRLLGGRVLGLLGGASYALYILQGPARNLCRALVPSPYDRVVSPVFTVALSVAVFLLIEKPARKFLMKALAGAQRGASQSPALNPPQ